jgi:hypothetical protein
MTSKFQRFRFQHFNGDWEIVNVLRELKSKPETK